MLFLLRLYLLKLLAFDKQVVESSNIIHLANSLLIGDRSSLSVATVCQLLQQVFPWHHIHRLNLCDDRLINEELLLLVHKHLLCRRCRPNARLELSVRRHSRHTWRRLFIHLQLVDWVEFLVVFFIFFVDVKCFFVLLILLPFSVCCFYLIVSSFIIAAQLCLMEALLKRIFTAGILEKIHLFICLIRLLTLPKRLRRKLTRLLLRLIRILLIKCAFLLLLFVNKLVVHTVVQIRIVVLLVDAILLAALLGELNHFAGHDQLDDFLRPYKRFVRFFL